jgi:hypothetical protein
VRWAGAVALSRDAHLSDDEAVAKMGHPEVGRRHIFGVLAKVLDELEAQGPYKISYEEAR